MNRLTLLSVGLLFANQLATAAIGATVTVTSTGDSGPGTLRDAIVNAGNNGIVNFSVPLPATITLTSGELLITNNLTINGPGAANLVVSGNNGSRVFQIGTSNTVTIASLTISDGLVSAGGLGAGIFLDSANLTLLNCAIRNNHATGGSTANGGGVFSSQSQLTSTGCIYENNVAAGNGGGIYNVGSTLTIDRTTITDNSGISGGGIFNGSGTVKITNSLFLSNVATHGGAAANVGALGAAGLTVVNCTFSGNTVSGASATGSQIFNGRQLSATSATVSNCTLLSNNVSPAYTGGAVFNDNGASISIGSTIIQASSQEHTIVNSGASSVTSAGYNLVFDNGAGLFGGSGDQINTDPLLDSSGPKDNGGPTLTIALQSNSLAIDKGKMLAAVDQRGEPRPFNDATISNAVGGDGSDIGAYEADLRLTQLTRMINDLQFKFTTVLGKTYQLQSRPSLVTGTWNSSGTAVAGTGGIVPNNLANAFGPPAQFYRILQNP